jgi:hypothetical protein
MLGDDHVVQAKVNVPHAHAVHGQVYRVVQVGHTTTHMVHQIDHSEVHLKMIGCGQSCLS